MSNLKEWHQQVCERDGYICRCCKQNFSFEYYFDENGVNQYVCGHHIASQKASPELKFDVSNGVCVCFDCHTKIHKGLIKNNFTNTKAMPKIVKTEPVSTTTIQRVEGKCKECKVYDAGTVDGLCYKCERKDCKPIFQDKKKKKKN